MAKITNITSGPKGAYNGGKLVMADPGQTIETDEDVVEEWFARASSSEAKEAAEAVASGEPVPAPEPTDERRGRGPR